MKRSILALAALAAMTMSASAQSSRSDSQSGATAIIYGNGGNANDGSVQRSRGRVATTANSIAPGLTAAGVHSCAGSVSAAGGGVGFGLSLGSTYEMQECNRRAYAATLMGMGQNAAALALVCNNAEVQNALNLTGVACPQQRTVAAAPAAQVAVVSSRDQRLYAASQPSQSAVIPGRGTTLVRSATPWRD